MLSDKPWQSHLVIQLFLAVIASFCAGIILASLVTTLHLGHTDSQRQMIQMFITGFSFHGMALIWITLFLLQAKLPWHEAFGFTVKPWYSAMGLGILMGVVVLPIMLMFQTGCKWVMETLLNMKADPQSVVQELMDPNVPRAQVVFVGVLAVLVAPVVEEILFRGILYPTLKRTGHPVLAAVGVSLFFAGIHWNLLSLFPLAMLSMGLIYLYEKSGNLLTSIFAHGTFNVINFVLLIYKDPILKCLNAQ